MALSGWLARRGGGTWYSLDAEDNDPAVFWPSVTTALELADASTLRTAARDVARALFDAPSRTSVLVLDDYHAITNPAVHAGIDQLLVEAPAHLRVVVASRHDPPLMLSRLRAQGTLRELRFEDLRFDPHEVGVVLHEVTGLALSEEELRRLEDRTDGWAAAVQLVGLSLAVTRTRRAWSTPSPATTGTSPTTSETRCWRGCPNASGPSSTPPLFSSA